MSLCNSSTKFSQSERLLIRCWNNAELLHHAHGVLLDMKLDDLAAAHTEKVYPGKFHWPIRRRDAHEVARLRATKDAISRYPIAFSDDVERLARTPRKCIEISASHILEFIAPKCSGHAGDIALEVRCDLLRCPVKIALVIGFVKTANNFFILLY